MDKEQLKSVIAGRAAKELKDGDVVNLGIGLPTLIPGFLPPGVRVILHSENGIIGMGPALDAGQQQQAFVVDAGGKPAKCMAGGAFIDSATSFGIIRGGHVDASFLGAIEVDREGNLANWIIPGKKVPGMGGAMDLAAGARRVIVVMEHTNKGTPKILERCSLPLTAEKCVDLITTEMGVFEVTPEGLLLKEINDEYSLEQVKAATGCELLIPEAIGKMTE